MSQIARKRVMEKRSRHRRARFRTRSRIHGTPERPRLAVHKSLKYIYAQVIDDRTGETMVQASSLEPGLRSKLASGAANKEAARVVGEAVAERAKEKGISSVIFDRGGYIYHGKVRALADGARSGGLSF